MILREPLENKDKGRDARHQVTLPMAKALGDIIHLLNDVENSGQVLWTPPELKSMSSWQQQDAQEYFSKLIDKLERESVEVIVQRRTSTNDGLGAVSNVEAASDGQTCTNAPVELPTESNASVSVGGALPSTPVESSPPPLISSSPGSEERPALNPFEGTLAQSVRCLKCGWSEGFSMSPFICLTLPLGRDWYYTVEACLDETARAEPIEGVECARCTLIAYRDQLEHILEVDPTLPSSSADVDDDDDGDDGRRPTTTVHSQLKAVRLALAEEDFTEATMADRCGIVKKYHRVMTTKSRQAKIARPPQCLVLHVNRSVFDDASGQQTKNYADVEFPKFLDLGPWCLDFAGGGGGGGGDDHGQTYHRHHEEGKCGSRDEPLDAPAPTDDDSDDVDKLAAPVLPTIGPMYVIRAVITHHGRHENGHYVCYRSFPAIFPLTSSSAGDDDDNDDDEKGKSKIIDLTTTYNSASSIGDPLTNLISDLSLSSSSSSASSTSPLPFSATKEQKSSSAEARSWWRISDDHVSSVTEEDVLNQGGVFMLFYEKIPE